MFLYQKEMEGVFYKEPQFLGFDNHDIQFLKMNPTLLSHFENNRGETLCSEREKVFIRLRSEYFHCIMDTLAIVLQEHKKNPDMLFIINFERDNLTSLFDNNYTPFLFDILRKKKIEFRVTNVSETRNYMIDNFWFFPMYPVLQSSVENILEEIDYLFNKEEPTKNVYLSRRKTPKKPEGVLFSHTDPSKFLFKDDQRIEDDLVRDYFISLGFDVVYPEDFNTMQEQIKYFSTVKTVVSVTGAGMLNLLFMPKGSKVIELVTPITINGTESIHQWYHSLSFAKKHRYTSIPGLRKAKDYIDFIESDQTLKGWIYE